MHYVQGVQVFNSSSQVRQLWQVRPMSRPNPMYSQSACGLSQDHSRQKSLRPRKDSVLIRLLQAGNIITRTPIAFVPDLTQSRRL
jgi:hypothetical protein